MKNKITYTAKLFTIIILLIIASVLVYATKNQMSWSSIIVPVYWINVFFYWLIALFENLHKNN